MFEGWDPYIFHFVCLHNFNYTVRPLRSPGIIGIILHKLRSKYEKTSSRIERPNTYRPEEGLGIGRSTTATQKL